MRVISGTAKGKRLKAPPGNDTRPITDMIKEALFNVLGQNVNGSEFLDLFAGSGSVGIEALSRGAGMVVFVDNSPAAIKTIRDNLDNCNFFDRYQIFKNDVIAAAVKLEKGKIFFDFIYIDPPFTQEKIFLKIMKTIDENNILKVNGNLIIRTPRKMELPGSFENIRRIRQNHYGESTLNYYQLYKEVNNNDGNSAYSG
ncbi:MAG TPA: 16S rRNA (guanine(966)-N(2))-methyltransferase RsmD [Syntrophomonadaceae bacterium]|nr:16S rRNA (guanine(966)-N(2))-methyltransferase RsmD [Syntrophomonadaceae bacterium]HNX27795.1 16S rRNA (guanine(966)-N(2))-methyltransferase RsmD [Syntrophomonadaceae bacterium]HPR93587.1 16S rRNA (guanine(966)-N(2))-methyltransferase RsmD [Syntrophomonadaceae bacterium]